MPHRNVEGSFTERFAAAVARSDMTIDQLSAQLMVRGARTSPVRLQSWLEGTELPSAEADLRVLRMLDILLPGAHLTVVDPPAGDDAPQWSPLVGIPQSHPAWARLSAVRGMTEQQFAPEVVQDSSVLSADHLVLERTIYAIARPFGAYRHEPSTMVIVPHSAEVEVVEATGRETFSDRVVLDERHDLMIVSRRRTSSTKAGRLIAGAITLRITAPEPITDLRLGLPSLIDLFTVDITFAGHAPSMASLEYRTDHAAPGRELRVDPGWHVQHSCEKAAVGLYDLRWD